MRASIPACFILAVLLASACGGSPPIFPSGVTLGSMLEAGPGSDIGSARVDARGDLWVPEEGRTLELAETTAGGQRRQIPIRPPVPVAYIAGTAGGLGEDFWFLALPQGVTGGVIGHATPGGVTYIVVPGTEGYGPMAVAGDGSLWRLGTSPSSAVLRRVAADGRSSRAFPLGVPLAHGAVVPAGHDGVWAMVDSPGSSGDHVFRAIVGIVTAVGTVDGTVASLVHRPDGGAWVLYQPSTVDHVQCRAALLLGGNGLPSLHDPYPAPLEDVPSLPTNGAYGPGPDEVCPAGVAGPDDSLWLGEHTQCFPHGCIPHTGPWQLLHVEEDGRVSRTPLPGKGEIAVRPARQGVLVWALELTGGANLAVAIDPIRGVAVHEYRVPRLPGYVIDTWVPGEGPALWVEEAAALVRLVPAGT